MGVVPVRPQARVAVTAALGSKLHWIKDAERAAELADTAIQAFLAVEEIAIEQREITYGAFEKPMGEYEWRLCGPWVKVQ
jgi:hypothetical protein